MLYDEDKQNFEEMINLNYDHKPYDLYAVLQGQETQYPLTWFDEFIIEECKQEENEPHPLIKCPHIKVWCDKTNRLECINSKVAKDEYDNLIEREAIANKINYENLQEHRLKRLTKQVQKKEEREQKKLKHKRINSDSGRNEEPSEENKKNYKKDKLDTDVQYYDLLKEEWEEEPNNNKKENKFREFKKEHPEVEIELIKRDSKIRVEKEAEENRIKNMSRSEKIIYNKERRKNMTEEQINEDKKNEAFKSKDKKQMSRVYSNSNDPSA